MKDANSQIQKAYFAALSGISYNGVAVPVFYMITPDNLAADNYIIFGSVSNTDISTKGSADTSTLMRVAIHTKSNKYNPGKAVNFIAGEVFNRIYPNSQATLPLDGIQMLSTEITSDITQDYLLKNTVNSVDRTQISVSFIDRTIIFKHIIFHQ